jgi:hypothetical protein
MAWGLPREPKYEERVASEIELREEYVGYPHPALLTLLVHGREFVHYERIWAYS